MRCKNCGNEIQEGAAVCGRCGAPVNANDNAESNITGTPMNKKLKVIIIVSAIAAAFAAIVLIILLLINMLGNKPETDTAAIAPTASPTVAADADKAEETAKQEDPTEKAAVSPTVQPTEASFSISGGELESEIEKIREYYYSPTSDDEKIVLDNGTDGWGYSRDYRFHNGKLIFAFIFDGTEEHRLYFKDDHMIRYIDENGVTYDFPDTAAYQSWADRALKEAYEKYGSNTSPAEDKGNSAWLGIWENEHGESFEITSVSASGLEAVHNHLNEKGDRWLNTPMSMKYTDSSYLTVIEDIDAYTWKYSFTLCDGYLLVKSRYPDMKYYKVS